MAKELNQKNKDFCLEYLIDFNAYRAYRKVYKCSSKAAEAGSSRLLKQAEIQDHLRRLTSQKQKQPETKAGNALLECTRIAFADVAGAFNDDGTLKGIHDIPADLRRAVSSLEVKELFEGRGKDKHKTGELKKINFWSKDRQIENLFKHYGLYEKDNEQSKSLTLADIAALMGGTNGSKN